MKDLFNRLRGVILNEYGSVPAPAKDKDPVESEDDDVEVDLKAEAQKEYDRQQKELEESAKKGAETKDEPKPETPEEKAAREKAEPPTKTPEELAKLAFDPDKVDENGVPWKNRAKEFERKYVQTLEQNSQRQVPEQNHKAEPPKESEAEALARMETEYNIPREHIPGMLKLFDRLMGKTVQPLAEKVAKNEANEIARVTENVFSKNKPDYADFRESINEEIKELSPEIKADPVRFSRVLENAYYSLKGKKLEKDMQAETENIRKREEEKKKILAVQPDVNQNGADKKKKEDQLSPLELETVNKMIEANMLSSAEEYIEAKKRGR